MTDGNRTEGMPALTVNPGAPITLESIMQRMLGLEDRLEARIQEAQQANQASLRVLEARIDASESRMENVSRLCEAFQPTFLGGSSSHSVLRDQPLASATDGFHTAPIPTLVPSSGQPGLNSTSTPPFITLPNSIPLASTNHAGLDEEVHEEEVQGFLRRPGPQARGVAPLMQPVRPLNGRRHEPAIRHEGEQGQGFYGPRREQGAYGYMRPAEMGHRGGRDHTPATSYNLPSSSFSPFKMLNYFWILLVISFASELFSAGARADSPTIMLPSQLGLSSPDSVLSPKCQLPDSKLNFRPVIGILSHPGDGASGRLDNSTNASYIAASYVKFVESAGARVIPLIYNEPRGQLLNKLNLVNGVLFTGGWAKSGLYFEIVAEIFKKVLEKNDAGQYFPCYAICLGFELLTMIVSKDTSILERYAASNQASTLQFVGNADIDGTVFQRFPPELLKKLSTECIVMQNHQYGVSPERLSENARLDTFFDILTTSIDQEDKVYVSTVRARDYPVTGFQWHPEKNAFEWGSLMIPHSEDAIQVTQHAANFFISEARKSLNRPLVREVLDNLIYNYRPTYCGKAGIREEPIVTAYFTKSKNLWDEYLRLCDSTDVINGVIQDQQVIQFLMGLNETYNAVRGEILAMNPPPSLNQVYQLVLQEEQKREVIIADSKLNFRPVIGILSHPARKSKASYIAASYVRFVQSAGARVIPLIYNEPRDKLFKKLSLVNGFLFTGGWAKNGLYLEIVEEIFKKVLENNDAGQYFPCYAICLGFELLSMIISDCKDISILERYAAKDQASTLQFVGNADIDGTVFQRFPPDLIEKLWTEKLVAQNHIYGISREKFKGNTHLNDFFDILTTSTDENDKEYVSTVQAKKYPITGFQWHPEKNAFEWGSLTVPHTEDAIQVMQHVANFFISEARKSLNKPLECDLLDNLIYNYNPTYSGKDGYEFDEIYIFGSIFRESFNGVRPLLEASGLIREGMN
ncbi:hypothetical protein V2J09_009107 [Rumex salicifolius]